MSEYWKSLPRKYCDMCKCWFADNKASIQFHERGKKHQENAAKRIQEIQKKGIKDAKKQKKREDDMAKIERAALAAYKKDLQNEALSEIEENSAKELLKNVPEYVPTKQNVHLPGKKQKTTEKNKKPNLAKVSPIVWYEAMTEEGYKYYWNTVNSESQWEAPKEGYVSLEEQKSQELSENVVQEKDEEDKRETKTNNIIPTCAIGPQPKANPYGQWITIEKEEPEEIDLQLPKPSEDIEEVVIPVLKDEPKLKIKEKVIGQLTNVDTSEEVTFKKRKFIGSSKRNTRQRTEDD